MPKDKNVFSLKCRRMARENKVVSVTGGLKESFRISENFATSVHLSSCHRSST